MSCPHHDTFFCGVAGVRAACESKVKDHAERNLCRRLVVHSQPGHLKMASEDTTPERVTLQQQLQAERDAEHRFDRLSEIVGKVLKPYLDRQKESFQRVDELLSVAADMPSGFPSPRSQQAIAQDMLRAAVVLIHAYLEDFLRTIARALLPEANAECLDKIPLAGLSGRPDKFSLGKLVRHKGKLVDEVLRESVSEHLDRTTFNNKGEIANLLETLGFELAPIHHGCLVDIQEMMQRRHQNSSSCR